MIIPTYSQFRPNFALPAAPIEKDGFPQWPASKVRETGSGFGDAGSTIVNIPKPPRDYAPLYVSCNNFQPDAVPFLPEYRWYSSARSQDPTYEAVIASVPILRFVSGVAGNILDTVNGGDVWTQKTDPPMSTFLGVSRPTISDVWVVGADGAIAYSSTSGQTWGSQTSGVATQLTSAHFINSTTGWAAGEGAVVLKTTNGGALWTPLVTAPATFYIFDIAFADANVGVACGQQGKTIHTTDGGATWLSVNVPTALNIEAIDLLPGAPGIGWMVSGAGLIYKTIDGGASYVQQFGGGTSSDLSSISAVDPNVAYVAGSDGFIAKTVDGGASWSQLTVSPDVAFSDIKFVSPTIGWVATVDGKMFFTSDGGASWVSQKTFTDSPIWSLDSPSVNMGLVTFSGTIQLSPNTLLPESTLMTPESVSTTFKNCHLYVQRISDQAIQWVDLLRAMVANTG